jgi:hypothetical protein
VRLTITYADDIECSLEYTGRSGDRSFIRFRFMVYDPKYDIVKNQRRSSSPPAPARTSLTSLSQEPQHLPRHHLRPHGHGALLQRHALRRLQNHARAEAAGKTGHGQCQGPGVDRPVELSREGVREFRAQNETGKFDIRA